jgi:hypothetical protein
MSSQARAYVYGGDWVADCPYPFCYSTDFLFALRHPGRPHGPNNPREARKTVFLCSNCQQLAEIDWPPDSVMGGIMSVLALRPVPGTRNWYPKDHDVAVRFHVEHGQTVEELREENEAHGVAV